MNKKTRFYQSIKITGIGVFLLLLFVIVANTRAQTIELQLPIFPAEVPPEEDKAPPPSLTEISISGFAGISSTSGLPQTTDTTPTFSGRTSIKNAYMFFELYTKPITGTTRADTEGNWSWTVPFPLSIGIHTLYITAVDPADSSIRITSSLKFEVISKGITAPIYPLPSIPIIEEESKELLFGINLTIPQEYKKIKQGGNILADIKLFNGSTEINSETNINVSLDYFIKDNQESIISKEYEECSIIGTESSYSKIFKTPDDIQPGQYSLYADMIYKESNKTSSSDTFEIVKKGIDWKIWLIIIAIFISLMFVNWISEVKKKFKI